MDVGMRPHTQHDALPLPIISPSVLIALRVHIPSLHPPLRMFRSFELYNLPVL